MGINITLKNVPAQISEALKIKAKLNHRSLNQEAIIRLRDSFAANSMTVQEKLEMVRKGQEGIPKLDISNEELNEWKNFGRP